MLTVVYTQHMDNDTTAPAASLDDLRARLHNLYESIGVLVRVDVRGYGFDELVRQARALGDTIAQAERDEQSASTS